MCDIWKSTDNSALSHEDLERHLEDIERLGVKWVILSGGEPLMHPDLFRLCALLRTKNVRITMLSTGLLLERFAAQVTADIDDVIVSLDGPPQIHDRIRQISGAFSRLKKSVDRVRECRPDFPIASRCTVQRLNHQHIVETAEAANELGLVSISFLAADVTSEAFNRPVPWNSERQSQVALTDEEISVLVREFENLSEQWQGTGFVLESRDKLQRIVNHFRANLCQVESQAPLCNAPWVSAVIEANGEVRPCFFHKPVGSLRTHSLMQVLNGFEAQQFRSSLDVQSNAVCRRCVCSLNWKQ